MIARTMSNAAPTTPTTHPPLLVDTREMCRLIDTSERNLFTLRKRGLPAVQVGNALRYDPAEVVRWLKANNAAPTPAATAGEGK